MAIDARLRRDLVKRVGTLRQNLSASLVEPLQAAMDAEEAGDPSALWPALQAAAMGIASQMAILRQITTPNGAGLVELANVLVRSQALEHRFSTLLRALGGEPETDPQALLTMLATLVEMFEWHYDHHIVEEDHELALVGGTGIRRRPAMDMTSLEDLIRQLDELDARYADWHPRGDHAPTCGSADLLRDVADIVHRITNSAFRERLSDRVKQQNHYRATLANWFQRLVHRLAKQAYQLVGNPDARALDLAKCLAAIEEALECAGDYTEPLKEYVAPLRKALDIRLRERVADGQSAPETARGYGVLARLEHDFDELQPYVQRWEEFESLREDGFRHSRQTLDRWISGHQARLRQVGPGLVDVPALIGQEADLVDIRREVAGTMREKATDELQAHANEALRQRIGGAAVAVREADAGVKGFGALIRVWRDIEPAVDAGAGTPWQGPIDKLKHAAEGGIEQRIGTVEAAVRDVPRDLDGFAMLAGLLGDVGHLARQGAGTPFAARGKQLQTAVEQGLQERVDRVMETGLPPLGGANKVLTKLHDKLHSAITALPDDSPVASMLETPAQRVRTALEVAQKAAPVLAAASEAHEKLEQVLPDAQREGQEIEAERNHDDLVAKLPEAYIGEVPPTDLAEAVKEITSIRRSRDELRSKLEGAMAAVSSPLQELLAAQLPVLGDPAFRERLKALRGPLDAAARAGMAAHAASADARTELDGLNKRAKFILDSALSVTLKRDSAFKLQGRTDANRLLTAREKLIESIERRPVYGPVIWRLAENWAVPPLPDDVPAPARAEVTGLTMLNNFSRKGGHAEMTVVVLDRDDQPYRAAMRPENFSLRMLEVAADGEPSIDVIPGHARVLDVDNSDALQSGPIVSGLMMDCSGSLAKTDRDGHRFEAARELIQTLLRQQRVNLGLYSFHGRHCDIEQSVTRDQNALLAALEGTREKTRSKTPLWMSVVAVCDDLRANSTPDSRRVLVIFTDGRNDTVDETTPDEAVEAAIASKVRVFCVGLGRKFDSPELNRLCSVTRGTFARSRGGGLKTVFAAIARAVLGSVTLRVHLPLSVRPATQGLAGRTLDIGGELVVHRKPGDLVPNAFRIQTGY